MFGFGADALGRAVAVWSGRGDHCVPVSVQALGEGVQMGQIGCLDWSTQRESPTAFPREESGAGRGSV
jgi:hypothetical protein